MKQNNIRLIEEVAKLIVNILIKDGGVYLPSIGSLTLSSEEAGSTVTYSAEESHGSIVEVIMKRGNCSQEKAQKIYDKWLSLVKEESGDVSIRGVGKIEGGLFTISSSLATRLNPKVEKRSSRRRGAKRSGGDNTKIIMGGAAAAIVAAVVVLISLMNGTQTVEIEPQPQVAVAVEQSVVVEPEPVVAVAEEVIVEEPKEKLNNITSKARYVKDTEAEAILKARLLQSNDGAERFRVVCGVVLSPANAGRLILDVEARTDLTPRVYERSGGYMVTLYESDGFRPCFDFIQSTASKLYDYTWIYDEKTM